jgi:regulator of replication initiation timing
MDREYERGHKDGGTDERLDSHDRHFATINGHLADLVVEFHKMTLSIQHLKDVLENDHSTVQVTSEAVDRAAKKSWDPWQKGFAIITAIGALVAVYLGLKD